MWEKNAQSWEIVGQTWTQDGGSAGPGFLPGRPAASGLHERPAGAAECQGVNVMCKSYPKKKCNSPKISVNPCKSCGWSLPSSPIEWDNSVCYIVFCNDHLC